MWSQFRVDHIASNCSANSTFEIETHTTDDGGHFLDHWVYTWYSNLPTAYRDTNFGDFMNNIDGTFTDQWTIGTAQLDEVQPWVNYRVTMWTFPGASGTDRFMSNGQLGTHLPGCTFAWCISGEGSWYQAVPWTHVSPSSAPKTKWWNRSS